MKHSPLLPGFSDAVHDSQNCFRALMQGMSNPGRVIAFPALPRSPEGANGTSAAIALTLLDGDTPVSLHNFTDDFSAWLQFHCGCTFSGQNQAFAFIQDGETLPKLSTMPTGRTDYPNESVTLVIQVKSLSHGECVHLSGPGIKNEERLRVSGLASEFWDELRRNHTLFPQGFDTVLTAPGEIVCLPRTVEVKERGTCTSL